MAVKKLSTEDLLKLKAMHPGISVDLQLTTATGSKRVRSEFIGRDAGRVLMIKFPDELKWGNLRDIIYPETEMVVRYILEEDSGEIVAFRSKVLFVLTKPTHMIFLSFPTAIQLHGLRSTKRVSANIQAILQDKQDLQKSYNGAIVDISPTGCRFTLKKSESGDKKHDFEEIAIAIKTSSGEQHELDGVVANYKSDDLHHHYGIKLDAASDKVKQLLNDLLLAY